MSTLSTGNLYRLHKSLVGYCHAIIYSLQAKTASEAGSMHWAASSCYYSVFHLAGAMLYLQPRQPFNMEKEFIYPDARNFGPKFHRYLNFGHEELARQMASFSQDDRLFAEVEGSLRATREFRELAQYGPFMQITKGIEFEEGKSLTLHVRPLYIRSQVDLTTFAPRPFKPIMEIVKAEVDKLPSMIQAFADYFKAMAGRYTNLEVKASLMSLPIILWSYVYPAASASESEAAKMQLRLLASKFGGGTASEFDRMVEAFSSGRDKIQSGEIVGDIRLVFGSHP